MPPGPHIGNLTTGYAPRGAWRLRGENGPSAPTIGSRHGAKAHWLTPQKPCGHHAVLMKDCDTCGNEIPDQAAVCRFCGSRQAAAVRPLPKEKIRTISVKDGMPTVDEGMAKLEAELARAGAAGAKVVRVIHGYGSSGRGGALKDACRAFLTRELRAKRIRSFVPGEGYSRAAVAGRDLMGRWPDLKAAERTDSGNPGITMVEL